jgi:hypothetical protein
MYAANPVLVSQFFLSVKESLVMDYVLAIHQILASKELIAECFFFPLLETRNPPVLL